MTALNLLRSLKFQELEGKQVAILELEDWHNLLNFLETLEDIQIVKTALHDLQETEGDRQKAGWLKWNEVEEELE
ncbi:MULTISPECIES: hypothetical protein [Spirulina sp. CCY15215]|uniref:hypothetical protein n=1 Tax=Spirulina sp. CCY15215 TaxID=2767591 RepID=UPI001950734A|nr:hypothetical protein [Spirulina major]